MARSKKAENEGRTIIWVDESGFYPLPAVVRTYAPKGETPVLRAPLTRDHLSAISGITMNDTLLMMIQDHAYCSQEVVRFLRHLLTQLGDRLLVIWDGSLIHRGKPVRDFLAHKSAGRIKVEPLPGYAPEVNPDEGIWRYLKRVELRNLVCPTIPELRYELRLATARLRHKRHVIRGCIKHAGYHV